MEYSSLAVDDLVRLSLPPIDYRVIDVGSNRILLSPDSLEYENLPPIEFVKSKSQMGKLAESKLVDQADEWELRNVNELPLDVELLSNLPTDTHVTYMILNQLDLDGLIKVCQTDVKLNRTCQTNEYWRDRLLYKFGSILTVIFLSGPNQQPILEGDHSYSEYLAIESRLNQLIDNMLDDKFIIGLFNELFEKGKYQNIDEIMYMIRLVYDRKAKVPSSTNDAVFSALILSIIDGEYPIYYMDEFLKFGYPIGDIPYNALIHDTVGNLDEHPEYLEIWKSILGVRSLPNHITNMIHEIDEYGDLIELIKEYGYY